MIFRSGSPASYIGGTFWNTINFGGAFQAV
jgi:hypothetical protein